MSFSAFAQTSEKQTSTAAPTITKGYYSIGNNAAKLASTNGTVFQSVQGTTESRGAGKGFYSIRNNRNKLWHRVTMIPSDSTRTISRPTKGYYSIGNNAEKLNR